MSRKGNRGKGRRQTIDRTAWAYAIARTQPMDGTVADNTMLKIHEAYHSLRDGTGTDEEFDRLAATLNVGLIRAEAISQIVVDAMQAGQSALRAADERNGAHGRYGFSGTELQEMNYALETYEEILRNSTPAQMQAAMRESMRRMRQEQHTYQRAPRVVPA